MENHPCGVLRLLQLLFMNNHARNNRDIFNLSNGGFCGSGPQGEHQCRGFRLDGLKDLTFLFLFGVKVQHLVLHLDSLLLQRFPKAL